MFLRNSVNSALFKRLNFLSLGAKRAISTTRTSRHKIELKEIPHSDFAPKFKPGKPTGPFQAYEPREVEGLVFQNGDGRFYLVISVIWLFQALAVYTEWRQNEERIRQQKAGEKKIHYRYNTITIDEENLPPKEGFGGYPTLEGACKDVRDM